MGCGVATAPHGTFVAADHCSAACIGIHAARRATRFEALEPIRQGVRTCFGGFAEGVTDGLELRHDHGSQFVADDFKREFAFLGIAPSPAFASPTAFSGQARGPAPSVSFRTLKENLLWVSRFDSVEQLRQALHAFKNAYNRTWIIERHGYRTPAEVRADQLGLAEAA